MRHARCVAVQRRHACSHHLREPQSPVLRHKKALVINTTIWDERAYDAGLRAAMKTLIDEYTLSYPGIASVEHVYFYAVHGANDATRRGYLERAYTLGRDFDRSDSMSEGSPDV